MHLSPAVAPATATATASGVATKVWRMLMLTWSCPQNNKMILINFLLRNIPMLVFMRKLHILHECLWMCVCVLCMLSIKGIRNAIWGYVGNVRPSRSLPGSLYSSWVSPLGIQATAFVKRSLACDGLCVCVSVSVRQTDSWSGSWTDADAAWRPTPGARQEPGAALTSLLLRLALSDNCLDINRQNFEYCFRHE